MEETSSRPLEDTSCWLSLGKNHPIKDFQLLEQCSTWTPERFYVQPSEINFTAIFAAAPSNLAVTPAAFTAAAKKDAVETGGMPVSKWCVVGSQPASAPTKVTERSFQPGRKLLCGFCHRVQQSFNKSSSGGNGQLRHFSK